MSKLILNDTMDANVWAKEFMRINGGDLEVMRGWFANAIMTGYDIGSRAQPEVAQAERAFVEAINLLKEWERTYAHRSQPDDCLCLSCRTRKALDRARRGGE